MGKSCKEMVRAKSRTNYEKQDKRNLLFGGLDKIEMVERAQTDGEGGQIAERICHKMQMLKCCWWFVECCRFFPAFLGKR